MKNESGPERAIRVLTGLILLLTMGLVLSVHGLKYWPAWVGLVGLYPLLTGLTGFCPMYKMLGVTSYHPKSQVPPAK